MAKETNSETDQADDDSQKTVTDEDLRKAKYPDEVENSPKETDETSETEADEDTKEAETEDGQTAEEETKDETEKSEDTGFVKKFKHIKGDTPEEYAHNLEAAYENSTAEYHRLKEGQSEESQETEQTETQTPHSYTDVWAKQEIERRTAKAFDKFSKDYEQVYDPEKYRVWVAGVNQFAKVIYDTEGRYAPPDELYGKAAVALGWEKSNSISEDDKLKGALKDAAGSGRVSSKTKKTPASQVSDAEVALARKFGNTGSDAKIREELEAYKK